MNYYKTSMLAKFKLTQNTWNYCVKRELNPRVILTTDLAVHNKVESICAIELSDTI